jgi:4-hydroxy-tetrahydrodipicolinate reductase
MTTVTIFGAAGRMGHALTRCIGRVPGLCLAGAVERPDCPALGADAGLLAGAGETGVRITADASAAAAAADVLIDFSLHSAVVAHTRLAAKLGKGLVVGATGLTPAEKKVLKEAARKIPVVCSPNMSVGVNLLFDLVNRAAGTLGLNYDVEIVEMHHKFKKDAPSGTALRLAERVAEGRGQDLRKVVVYGRQGIGPERPAGEIGIHAIRGGDAVGDHTVFFATEGERLELTHRASNREAFAMGALRAALWLAKRKPGLYDMRAVLGL